MEVVVNNYLPGDQRLVDKIVYELKSQGIFDQFRKECFADVDTKPAYQNLRQRVEGSVAGFLREQSWRPDMNKNQVREMLRKTITESGFLETGVERIVDQVVNPKINTVFLPKVEEVVYSYLGIKKPSRNETPKIEPIDLLPTDLEAVSPESEPVDKKDDKSSDHLQDLDETKTEEDESPPFEPLEEQGVDIPQEENSVDSHLSGFSGLISHESNQSNENKVSHVEQDSQMSRNSSDSRLSIVTSDENSKMDICEDSQSKSIKSVDSSLQQDSDKDKSKYKSSDRHKSRSENKSDKDRRSSKDSRSKHSSSSKDKDKNRDRKDSKSSSSNKNDKDKLKDKNEKDRSKSSSSSSSKHSTSSKDKNCKKESKPDKDKLEKDKARGSYKDSKPRDKLRDSKSKEKSSSSDKHKHPSLSSHSEKHKKDKDKKKDPKSKDDHYSSKDKKSERRSTDRDSNDGQSGNKHIPTATTENNSSQSRKSTQETNQGAGDAGNADQVETTTKAPVFITGAVETSEVTIVSPDMQRLKVFKPKCASNIQEALRLMKIRKQLAKLEKQNQLSLASVDLNSPILLSSSIDLDQLRHNGVDERTSNQQSLNSKIVAELKTVPSPLQNTVISKDNWDAMEAKLRQEVCSEFKEFGEESFDESNGEESTESNCKFFDSVDIDQIEFLKFVNQFIEKVDKCKRSLKRHMRKRKIEENDLKNNNKKSKVVPMSKRKIAQKMKEKVNSTVVISANEKFSLPLSPAESDKSIDKKDETVLVPLKTKRNSINKVNNQRYSSDDLYKPRLTFTNSRRRGAKNLEK